MTRPSDRDLAREVYRGHIRHLGDVGEKVPTDIMGFLVERYGLGDPTAAYWRRRAMVWLTEHGVTSRESQGANLEILTKWPRGQ